MYLSIDSFMADAHHNKLLLVPAGLYALNNYLKFIMQLYFKPTTTKMLGNLKVTIVLASMLILNNIYNLDQFLLIHRSQFCRFLLLLSCLSFLCEENSLCFNGRPYFCLLLVSQSTSLAPVP